MSTHFYEPSRLAPVAPVLPGHAPGAENYGAGDLMQQVLIAHRYPRDLDQARQRMLALCRIPEVAEEAFWEWQSGGETIQGLTLSAMCELARAWRNIAFGLDDVHRDDIAGRTEQIAWAWDLESNFRPSRRFYSAHVRDGQGGLQVQDDREIYGVTTSQGNRRVRSCIRKALPPWFVRAAEAAFTDTLRLSVNPKGAPLPQVVNRQTAVFMEAWDITRAQLEEWRDKKPLARWSVHDLVRLRVLDRSLARGEVAVEQTFSARRITADELPPHPQTAAAPDDEAPEDVAEAPAEADPAPAPRRRQPRKGARAQTQMPDPQ